jgi:hypothetical protein
MRKQGVPNKALEPTGAVLFCFLHVLGSFWPGVFRESRSGPRGSACTLSGLR